MQSGNDVEAEFKKFWDAQGKAEIEKICSEENLDADKVTKMISSYLFTERLPFRDDVVNAMNEKPKLLKRKAVSQRVLDKVLGYIKTFIDGAPE